MSWKTRTEGTAAQIGQRYKERPRLSRGRTRASGADLVPQSRSVDSMKSPRGQEVQLKDLRDPHSGAPLEPASEYGSSIYYSPYTGSFVMVTTPKGGKAKPRFTEVNEGSLKIAKSYLEQAADAVEDDHSMKGLEKGMRHLDDAQRVEPWSEYPRAGLEKDPVYTELKQANNFAASMYHSAIETSNPVEKQRYIEKARARILSAKKAIVG